jgi:membrane protease subunit HflC
MTARSLAVGTATVLLVTLAAVPFVVDVTEYAVVTRFGRPIRSHTVPGLFLRLPFVDRVARIDARVLLTEPPPTEYLTADKKNVVARSFLTWRVADPLRFLQTVVIRETADARLATVAGAELGAALGAAPFEALVSTNPARTRLVQLVSTVEQRVREAARRDFGIDVVAFRLERLAFPQQNESAVYQRMRAERERIAKQLRSEGEEQALRIRADADLERARILADADRRAAEVRGEAEAEAAAVYADALGSNPAFYGFVRTLEAYDKIIDGETTLVLPADSPLMSTLLTGPPETGPTLRRPVATPAAPAPAQQRARVARTVAAR